MNVISESQDIRFSSEADVELGRYQEVSRLAIFGCLFGVLSPLALAHPLLWVVPVIGLCLSIGARRAIAARPEVLTGHRLALLGMGLSLFFGAWAPAAAAARAWVIHRQARHYADLVLELVRDHRVQDLYQQTMPLGQRTYSESKLREIYEKNDAAARKFQDFAASKPLAELMKMSEDSWHYRGSGGQATFERDNYVTLKFDYRGKLQNVSRTIPIQVSMQRRPGSETIEWQLTGISGPDPK